MNNTLTKIFKMLGNLGKNDLIVLNKAIVELIKNLENQELVTASTNFTKGDIVSFVGNNNIRRFGVIAKKNQKTFQVITEDSYVINVPSTYLRSEHRPSEKLLKFRQQLLITNEDILNKLPARDK